MSEIIKLDDLTVERFLDDIEENFSYEKVKQLILLHKLSGIGLAKALWLAKEYWDDDEQEFYDYAVTEWGLKYYTVTRYVRVWEFLENVVPQEHKGEFLDQGIKQLIPPAVAHDNGELPDLSEERWEELATAPDHTSTSAIIREIKGKEVKKGTLSLQLDRSGDIIGYVDQARFFVGFLDTRSEDENVKKAINRILNKTGIMKH